MSKTDQVPVFWRDQNDLFEHPAHIWTRSECRQAKNVAGKFFNNGQAFRLFSPRPEVHPITAAMLQSSSVLPEASTITLDETLANVGIAGVPEDIAAPRHLVKRAQAKIKAYTEIYDDRAVVALRARPRLERLEVSVIQ